MPRFMAIILDDTAAAEEDTSPEQWQGVMDAYNEFGANAGAAGVIGGGEALQPPVDRRQHQGRRQGRQGHPHREALRGGQGGRRRLLPARRRGPGRGDQLGRADPGCVARQPGRGPAVRRLQHRGLSQLAAEAAFQAESPRTLATLTRVLGSLDLAEDAVQDAYVVALERWPQDGIPDNPGAWITTTARNKALDRLRREAKRQDKQQAAAPQPGGARRLEHARPERRPRRPPAAGLHVLPPVAPDRGPRGARPPDALRALHRRGGPPVPRAGGDDGAAARPGQAPPRRRRDPVRGARRPTSCPTACPPSSPPCTCSSPRATRPRPVATHVRRRAVRRGQAPGRPARRAHARRTRGARAPRADRADGRPARHQGRRRRASWSPSRTRTARRWDHARHRSSAADAGRAGAAPRRGRGRTSCRPPSPRATRRRRPTPTPTGPRSRRSTACSSSSTTTPSPASTEPWRWPRPTTPPPALALLDDLDGLDDHHLRWAVEADLLRRLERLDDARAAYDRALACSPNDVERRFLGRRRDELLGFGGDQGGR